MRDLDHAIAELASGRDGVLSRSELEELGAGRGEIATRIRRARLHRIHRGVYAVGHRSLTRRGRRRAALLAYGPDAALSGRSGAAHCGLSIPDRGPVHIIGPRRLRRQTGIVARSGAVDADDLVTHDGLPVLTAPRLLLELASAVGRRQLDRLVAESANLGQLDPAGIDDVLRRFAGHRGIVAFRDVTAGYRADAATRSPYEAMFLALWARTGLPRPAVNVPVGDREVDFLWPRERLIVEIDGFAAHRGRESFESDRRRAVDLRAAGYEYVAFTPRQLERDPGWIVGAATAAFRSAAARAQRNASKGCRT